MSIPTGTRLGPYEVLAPIGAGGMGEVYRGKDTRLDRIVAIKVLPSHLSSNPDLKQRFEREARAISSFSHPHICTLHDIGNQNGVDYLVMEYLEGETVADRLKKGPLTSELVLRYGMEIADALDKAHKQGIVHRDLKPGNIMLTKSGAKLLDFGLARLVTPASQPMVSGVSALATEANKNLTAEGSIVGTFQYMAPEQLEGKESDSRTDIFAFGSVLYEMITGRKAFVGTSQASLIAAILEKNPQPVSELQPMTPPALDRVIRTCIAKDPDDRWQSARDLLNELKWIREGSSQAGVPAPVKSKRKIRQIVAWILALLFFFATLILAIAYYDLFSRSDKMRVSVLPPDNTTIQSSAISPDGKYLAIVAADPSAKVALWVRSIDSPTARMLSDTDDASTPFWSPDSHALGFFSNGKLKKIDINGQRAMTLCDVTDPKGGAWSPDGDTIVFSSQRLLFRVSSIGGTPAAVTKLEPNEEADRWPCFLPDNRHFLFLGDAFRTPEHHLRLGSLDSTESTQLLSSFVTNVLYSRDGYILYLRQGVLMAQPFDAKHLRLSGEPVAVAEHIAEAGTNHQFDFSVSDSGILAYRPENPNSQLTWFDRNGNMLGVVGEPGRIANLELSPDDRRVAIEQLDADNRNGDIWILDPGRGTTTRFTFDPMWDAIPVWSPDGSHIAFRSDRNISEPSDNLYWKDSGGGGNDEVLLLADSYKDPLSWTPDGKYLLFEESREGVNNSDIKLLSLADHRITPILQSQFNEYDAQFSPDGKRIAYVSDESGRSEIYIQSFPLTGAKWQISTGGGSEPRWRNDGKELFFIGSDGKLWSVAMDSDSEPGIPRSLFEIHGKVHSSTRHTYSVSRDGQRFLVNAVPQEVSANSISLIFNWPPDSRK